MSIKSLAVLGAVAAGTFGLAGTANAQVTYGGDTYYHSNSGTVYGSGYPYLTYNNYYWSRPNYGVNGLNTYGYSAGVNGLNNYRYSAGVNGLNNYRYNAGVNGLNNYGGRLWRR